MNKETTLKLRPHSYYYQKFYKQLAQPCSVIEPLAVLCGGWYFQTFKQVTNKLSKNKSSPLPMYFPNVDSMDSISKNRQLLKSIFKGFDTRALGKIDACELYSSLLILSKGSYEVYLKTIVDIFGFQIPGKITRYEFFFFLDSFYRAIPKILIVKGFQKPTQQNIRLEFKDINRFIEKIFQEKEDMQRGQIYEALMKQPQLNDFLKYLQKKCMNSAQHYRNTAINKIKLQSEVRSTLTYILNEVEKRFKGDNLMLNQQL